MMPIFRTTPDAQRGIVLVASLLLLIVVTLLALSMFRSMGIQEKMAGNMREKQRALQAAESAQQYAEAWLANGATATLSPVTCNSLLDGNANLGQICSNKLGTAQAVMDWSNQVGAAEVGVTFKPPAMTVNATAATDTYADKPRYYIADLGPSIDANVPGEIYQIDAVGYGGNTTTAAVVESTFAVYVSSRNLSL